MRLDVSPDGNTIVFDLLGDIYSLPIEAGKAIVNPARYLQMDVCIGSIEKRKPESEIYGVACAVKTRVSP